MWQHRNFYLDPRLGGSSQTLLHWSHTQNETVGITWQV